jgi:hypothetical protein
MKIETAIIPNTSFTSFVVMGCHIIPSNYTIRMIGKLLRTVNSKPPFLENPITIDSFNDNLSDILEVLVEGTDLVYSVGQWDGKNVAILGLSYDSMEDYETLNQFRQRVRDRIKKVFAVESGIGHVEQCWVDTERMNI